MKKIIVLISIILPITTFAVWYNPTTWNKTEAPNETQTLGATVFRSSQVGSNPVVDYYLKTDGTNSTWAAVVGGGGSGGGTFSTTTVNGMLLQYPYTTLITNLDGSATTTSDFWFDPAISKTFLSYASSTALTSTNLFATNFTLGTLSGILKGTSGVVGTATAGVDYENPLTFTYPLQRSTNTISLAFGTTTSNTWAGVQTFTNAPVISSLTGVLKGNGSSALTVAANGTDYTLISATTCGGTDKVSAISASGAVTCSTDSTGGGSGVGTVSTSTTPTIGNLAYWTSTAYPSLLGSVSTSSLAVGTTLLSSGTLGSQVGGTNTTLSLNLASANTWSALTTFQAGTGNIITGTGAAGATLLLQESGGGQGGSINFGNNTASIGISTDGTSAGYDYDGAFILRQTGTNPDSDAEFIFIEEAGTWRFALPKSGAGLGTYNPRSMIIAGPATSTAGNLYCSSWGFGLIDCNTSVTGADLGVQDDLQVLGTAYFANIVSTSTASTTLFSANWAKIGGTASTTLDSTGITAEGNISFNGEIQPDGATCSDGQILKKTGENNWDCAADSTSAGGGDFAFTPTSYGGNTVNSTSTTLWLQDVTQYGMIASTTLTDYASTTGMSAITGWFTNLFIGVDTIAEYIADTAGAMFTGNTETGVAVTYQDADNTIDVVCDTASGSVFGCLSAADWTTFNNKWDLASSTIPINKGGTGLTAVGASSTILTTNGTIMIWQDMVAYIRGLFTGGRSITTTAGTIDIDSELYTMTKSIAVSASTEITATTTVAQMMFPSAVTITRVACSTDVGTAVIQGDERAAATPNTAGTDVMSSTLTCDNDEQTTTSFANASIAANVPLNFDIDSVATNPRRLRINVTYTIDD